MASPDLDDLLKSIRDEAKKESALAVYEGDADKKMVDEEIDERILNLLGLDDAIGIDYATYKTLLRERMAAGRMADSKIPTEETEILTEEFKKVKRKTGRFKVKKKKIRAQDIQTTSPMKKLGGITAPKLLPPAKEEEKDYIGDIIKSLDNIIGLLKEQNTLIKDTAESKRKKQEQDKRSKAEQKLEAGRFKKIVEGAEKMVAPVKGIIQRILDFFMKILLGKFLISFIDWFADPKNQDKLNAIGEFLNDHWPKLAAGFLLFGTGLGGFVRSLIGLLAKGAVLLVKAAAGLTARALGGKGAGLARFLGGGKGKLLTGLLTTGATVATGMFAANKIEDVFKGGDLPDVKVPTANYSGGGGVFSKMMGGMMGMVGNFGKSLSGTLGTLGGFVSGEKGVDKVPAMLSDGEFVMSRGAVKKYGVANLEAMNASGGGNNRPKIVQNVIKAHGGGLIGGNRLPGDGEKVQVGGQPFSGDMSSIKVNMGGSSGGSSVNNTNIKIGGGSIKKNMVSASPTINPKLNVSGGNNTYASFGGNSLSVFSPNINSAMFGGGNNMIFGVNNVLPMMMMVANNMQQSSKSTMGTQGSMKPIPQLKPNKAKVSIPGAPSRTPVALQAPATTTTTSGSGYASGEMRDQEQIPNFDASFSSMDKSRNSKILGIF
tara:strand:+ start:1924 stop:3894 length:1971 start_codon:yes stop_codon:yes gene_type:complete